MSAAALARAAVIAAAAVSSACGPSLMRLPSGPGEPAPDGAEVLAQATAVCSGVKSIVTEAAVSGRIGGRRLRARLLAGLQAPDAARLEAFAFGQQVFILAARDGQATLLLTRGGRVLESQRPEKVLEAVTGVPLDPSSLRIALTGCTAITPSDRYTAARFGENARVLSSDGAEWHVQRESSAAPWHLVAAVHREAGAPEWRAEYRDFDGGLPQSVRLVSTDRDRFDLRLGLTDPEVNTAIDPAAFRVAITPGLTPITLDELRAAGPLAPDDPGDDR